MGQLPPRTWHFLGNMRASTGCRKTVLANPDAHHPSRPGTPPTLTLVSEDVARMVVPAAHDQAGYKHENKSDNGEEHGSFCQFIDVFLGNGKNRNH